MIELFTASTPNGWKASVALEEMGLEYHVRKIALRDLEQKEPWFLKINPNGRIPVITDTEPETGDEPFSVFESGAILLYLARKTGQLMPQGVNARSTVVQWLMFQMGGLGPMMGQANVFFRYAPDKIEYAINRYQTESRRLLAVLDQRLSGHEFLAGDYSIADVANWCWARTHAWSGVDIDGLDHLQRWLDQVGERPAVKRGMDVPDPIKKVVEEAAQGRIKDIQKMLP